MLQGKPRKSEVDERVQRDPLLARDRRCEVLVLDLLVVQQERRRYRALMRQPIGDAVNCAIALGVVRVVGLEMVEANEPFKALCGPGRGPERPPLSLDLGT